MGKLGLVVASAAGLAVSLLAGQAFAAPTCAVTIPVANGGLIGEGLLGPGVCVSAADKTYGNFTFGTLPALTTDVLFSWTAPVGGVHTEEFVTPLANLGTTDEVFSGIGFEVEVNATGAGNVMTALTGDFDLTIPGTGNSSLDKVTNGGTILCTRPGGTTICPETITLPDLTDLTIAETFTLAPGGISEALINSVTQSSIPEPMTLTLFGSALVGLGVIRRRLRKG